MADYKSCPGLTGEAEHVVSRQLEDLSDLRYRKSGVAVQDDGNTLLIGQSPEIHDDLLRGWHGWWPVDELYALPVFPRQVDGRSRRPYHGLECLHMRMGLPRPMSVELRKDQLDDPIGLHRIAREEVSRGLDERTLPLDHGGILLITDRRHAPTSHSMVIRSRLTSPTRGRLR
jgi:hypothetical protein